MIPAVDFHITKAATHTTTTAKALDSTPRLLDSFTDRRTPSSPPAIPPTIQRILALPSETILWMCHDYKAPGRDNFAWRSTVGEERAGNVHVHDGIGEDEFVAKRIARDRTLEMPVLILPSVQVNIRAGHMPPAEADGHVYLKLPVNRL